MIKEHEQQPKFARMQYFYEGGQEWKDGEEYVVIPESRYKALMQQVIDKHFKTDLFGLMSQKVSTKNTFLFGFSCGCFLMAILRVIGILLQ